MKTTIKIIFASAITLFAAAPAAFAQSWGNTSTPGVSQLKDDQTITTTLNNYRVPYVTGEHTSRSSSQTTGWGNASTPGVSQLKDDTIPYGR